jgi:serine protease Do
MRRLLNLTAIAVVLLSSFVLYKLSIRTDQYVSIIEKSLYKTVDIHVTYTRYNATTKQTETAQPEGSGVFITDKGHILTCAHLFKHSGTRKSITVLTYTGDMVAGELILVDTQNDLALIRAPYINGNKYAELADPRLLRVGQEVFAIGSPLGLIFSVANGILSATNRDYNNGYNLIQSNTSVNPGNSGGPIFNLNGEVVGIVSFTASATASAVPLPISTGLGFAVSSGQCFEFLVRAAKKDASVGVYRRYHWLRQALDLGYSFN